MKIEQPFITRHHRFQLNIESDDLFTHSQMQSLTFEEKAYLKDLLLEVAQALDIFMPKPNGKPD
jgi:hypothetical protein